MIRAAIWTSVFGGVLAVALLGCPPSPAPVPPDANDAAPLVDTDGASPSCADACAHLKALGCPTELDCAATYANVEARHETRTGDNRFLTCAMVSAAPSKEIVRALSIGCP